MPNPRHLQFHRDMQALAKRLSKSMMPTPAAADDAEKAKAAKPAENKEAEHK